MDLKEGLSHNGYTMVAMVYHVIVPWYTRCHVEPGAIGVRSFQPNEFCHARSGRHAGHSPDKLAASALARRSRSEFSMESSLVTPFGAIPLEEEKHSTSCK